MTHLSFASWCPVCVRARAADDPHQALPEGAPPGTPIVQIDFFFLNRREDQERATGVCLTETSTKAIACSGIPAKGKGLYSVEFVLAELSDWGLLDIVLRSDQEPAISSLCSEVRGRRGLLGHKVIEEKGPRYSHASLGNVGRRNRSAEQQVRCISAALLDACGYELTSTFGLLPWAIRHGGWILHRYRVLDTGRTSFRHIRGRDYRGEVCVLGEQVWARDYRPSVQDTKLSLRWRAGTWLG